MLLATFFRTSDDISLTSVSIFFFKSFIDFGPLPYTRSFKNPHKKKSGIVKSGDRGGHTFFDMSLVKKFFEHTHCCRTRVTSCPILLEPTITLI